jgi:putative transposase
MEAMITFIDEKRHELVVEPIRRTLGIAPLTFHAHDARRRRPERAPPRSLRDMELRPEIQRIYDASFQVYGVRKVWRQMLHEGFAVARCTVSRLMKTTGLEGVFRRKPHRTTIPDKAAPCSPDRVNWHFKAPAPNTLWVADFTYVVTWQGFVWVAFVLDVFARNIVG